MHVAFVSNLYPLPNSPHRGTFSRNIVAHLSGLCRITVIAPLPWVPESRLLHGFLSRYDYARAPYRTEQDGIRIYYPKYPIIPKISDSAQALFMTPVLLKTLSMIHASDPIDLINAHWAYPDGVASYRAARRLGLPCIITALGDDINVMLGKRLIKRQLVKAIRNTERVTSVSRQLKERIRTGADRTEKVTVIPNGVNLKMFAPKGKMEWRAKLGLDPDASIIVYIGRLSPEKGPQFLIQSVQKIVSSKIKPSIKLVVVGDGPLMPQLKNAVADNGLEKTIAFAGEKPQSELPGWIAASDVLCLPSLQEGHPNVCMEALASGRPVVASNVGSLSDYIHMDNGILFPAGDVTAMADSLLKALCREWDPAAIRKTVETHSWEHCAAAYLKEYRACLN